MVSGKRDSFCARPEYEQQRDANVLQVKEKLYSLNIPKLRKEPNDQPKTRKKRPCITVPEPETRILRPRQSRNYVEKTNEEVNVDADYEPIGDFFSVDEDIETSPHKKRAGRGITRMEEVFARTPDDPKIKIELNQYGQPVGSNSREFASVIGCLVRKISVQFSDWRLVDSEKKRALWDSIKAKYDIHDDGIWWVLKTAGKKWKEFKALLKKLYFDESLPDEQLKKMYDDRVSESDWQYLINHWKSPEFQVRTQIAKANRAKLDIHHTSGTKSFARCRHELARELGRPPGRDDVYIKTHTRKNGRPTPNAEPIINKLKEAVEAHPELKEKTIEQGDVLSVVCGAREPRGRVRTFGLGPTSQDVRVPGMKCYPSTRLQMEVLARKTAEQRIAELEEQMKRQEERHAEERQNFMEAMSHNGSNSRQHVTPRSAGNVDNAHHQNASSEEDEHYGDNDDPNEYLFAQRCPAAPPIEFHQHIPNSAAHTIETHATSPHQCSPKDTTLVAQHHAPLSRRLFSNNVAPTIQHRAANVVQPNATPAVQNDAAQVVQPDAAQRAKPAQPEVAMKVILYEVVRSNTRVALGTVISTDPTTVIGGVALGKQYIEVIVTHVFKRDAVLPRPYPGVEKMADAYNMSLAWPKNRVKQLASKSVLKASGLAAGGGKNSALAAAGERS